MLFGNWLSSFQRATPHSRKRSRSSRLSRVAPVPAIIESLEDRVLLTQMIDFTIDAELSSVTLTGSIVAFGQNVPVEEQGTMGDTTAIGGSLQVTLDDAGNPTSISIDSGTLDAETSIDYQPAPGGQVGTSALAALGFEGEALNLPVVAAIRNLQSSVMQSTVSVNGSGEFESTQTIQFLGASIDYAVQGLTADSITTNDSFDNESTASSTLVDLGDGVFELTIPLSAQVTIVDEEAGVTANFFATGQIVAVGEASNTGGGDLSAVATELDMTYGFSGEATNYFDYYGDGEKWLQASNGDWYFLLTDGAVVKWDGSSSATGTTVGMLDAEYYADPSLLYDAYTVTGTPAELDEILGFTKETTSYFDYYGEGEKWLRAQNGDWYILLPDGDLVEWDGTSGANGSVVAMLGVEYYNDPSLLFNASVPTLTPAEVDQLLGFVSEATSYFDFYGEGEKWLQSAANDWYILLEDGSLLEWDGSSGANGELVTVLGANVYANPELLFNAYQLAGNPAEIGAQYGFASEATQYFDFYGASEKWLLSANQQWFILLPNGDLLMWSGSGSATGTLIASLGSTVYDNISMLFAS